MEWGPRSGRSSRTDLESRRSVNTMVPLRATVVFQIWLETSKKAWEKLFAMLKNAKFFCRVGSVGFVSVLFPFILPLYIVRIDEATGMRRRVLWNELMKMFAGDPIRGADGLAVECNPGEAGELIGRIDEGHPVRDFHGYSDNSSTSKKIMKDVFKQGDMYFRWATDNLVSSVRNM